VPLSAGRARRIAGHCGRVALGLVFLLAGVLKALDPAEFARQIAGYGLVGGTVAAAGAPLLIALEIGLGAALLLGAFPMAAAGAGCGLLAGFIAIEAYGLMHGRTEACGCFGAYVQRTPREVIAEDLLFIGFGILAVWGLAGWRGLARRAAVAALPLAGAVALALPLASPHLPLDRLLTRLAPGRTLDDLGIRAHLPSLAAGRHLIALIDVTEPAAAATAAALDALAAAPGSPAIVALTPATPEEVAAFQWSAAPGFEVRSIDRGALKPLYRRLPRFFLLQDGRVVWVRDDAPPDAADLLSSEAS
jgi:uncharacterized membrane protein YphA (DoxX/SURF4 family)